MSSFYLTLPSNSSIDAFPENTLTHYVTKLPDRFDLLGEWEVGLSEMQYPISWYNVSKEDVQLEMYHVDPSSSSGAAAVHDVSPPPGHYDSPDALVKQINATIASKESKKNLIRFSYNEISKKITITFGPDAKLPTVLVMSKMFAELAGFSLADVKSVLSEHEEKGKEDDNWWKIKGTANRSITGSNVCDLQRGFYSLFVYCDVVEHVVVGDVKAPLLRTVNITGKEGLTVNRIFQTVQYVPVQRKQFSTIEIDIRDDTGRPVPFQRGKVIVTLHFRRKRPAYFS